MPTYTPLFRSRDQRFVLQDERQTDSGSPLGELCSKAFEFAREKMIACMVEGRRVSVEGRLDFGCGRIERQARLHECAKGSEPVPLGAALHDQASRFVGRTERVLPISQCKVRIGHDC